jgi:HlyD family secretion protein
MTRSDVAVKYPGRLLDVAVHEGDLVQQGQVIARQDGSDIDAQLAGAEAARARAVAALQRAEGEQGARAEQAKLAAVEWRETAKLRAQAMVSAVELEQREIARDAAGAGVAAAGGGVGEARAAIAQAEAQIRQLKPPNPISAWWRPALAGWNTALWSRARCCRRAGAWCRW